MNPLISINISCYNRTKMLTECIDSFICQFFTNWELIIVDDGSEEDLSFVKNLDYRIKYFRQEHGGMAKGLNLAASKSSGEYIMPFGSDDLASDNFFLQNMSNAVMSFPNYDIFYCDHWLMKGNGSLKRAKYENIGRYSQRELYKKMLKKQLIAHGGTLWKKEKMLPYDISVSPADDWDLFLTAVENGLRFFHIPKKMWTYRVGHPRDSGTKAMEEASKRVLQKRGITI